MSALMSKSIVDNQRQLSRMAAIVHQMSQRTSAGTANPNPNPHGWKSWRDIPDSMIPTTSKRDPNNPIYGTRKYVDYRKQQIWMQMDNGVPVWLKNGWTDKALYYGVFIALGLLLVSNGYYMADMIFGVGKPKKK